MTLIGSFALSSCVAGVAAGRGCAQTGEIRMGIKQKHAAMMGFTSRSLGGDERDGKPVTIDHNLVA